MNNPAINNFQNLFAQTNAAAAQQQAFASFVAQGLPTRRNEAWKYTDLNKIIPADICLPQQQTSTNLSALLQQHRLAGANNLVVYNGKLLPELSDANAKLKISSGISATNFDKNSLVALNQAFNSDVLQLEIDANCSLQQPLHIIHCCDNQAGTAFINTAINLSVAANSHVTLLETYVPLNAASKYFVNIVNNIKLANAASLQHLQLQLESQQAFHIQNAEVTGAANSTYNNFALTKGALVSHQSYAIHLVGTGAAANMQGIYTLSQRQHADHVLDINHKASHTESTEFYRGIMQDYARGIFNGKITVAPHVEQIIADMVNNNLLLSATAEADTRPQLEIYADDVKCNHGATVGQLDEKAIYYMQSRGIAEAEARNLLIQAFIMEVVEKLQDEVLQQQVKQHVE